MYEIVYGVIKGAVAGAVYGVSGYLKSRKKGKEEDFEATRLVGTMVLGGLVGSVADMMGIPMEQAIDYLLVAGFVGVIENLIKAVVRHA